MKKSDQKIIDAVQAGKCTVSIVTPKAGEGPEASQARVIAENPANALIARLMSDFSAGGFEDPAKTANSRLFDWCVHSAPLTNNLGDYQ